MTAKEQQITRIKLEAVLDLIGLGRFRLCEVEGKDHPGYLRVHSSGTFDFCLKSYEETKLHFTDLDKLSIAFKTKRIDWQSKTEREAYCSSCHYEDTQVVIIDVFGATVK